MRGIVAQILAYVGYVLWPPGPPGPYVKPLSDEEKHDIETMEAELRSELVRAQSEAMRFRTLASMPRTGEE